MTSSLVNDFASLILPTFQAAAQTVAKLRKAQKRIAVERYRAIVLSARRFTSEKQQRRQPRAWT